MRMRAEEKVVWEDFKWKKIVGFSECSKFKPSFPVLIEMYSHLGGTSTHRLLHLTSYLVLSVFYSFYYCFFFKCWLCNNTVSWVLSLSSLQSSQVTMLHRTGLLYANPADSTEKHISRISISRSYTNGNVLLKLFWNKKTHLKEKWLLCVWIILHCCAPEGGLSPGIPADLEQS